MPENDLSEIKKIRYKLGLTQIQLSKKAGVSQSLIAKLEAGKLEPGYTRTKQIFDALEELTHKVETTAKDIMKRKVITASSDDKVSSIIKTMKKHAISQLPILQREKPVGLITESILLDELSNGEDIMSKPAKDIMKECPPIIAPSTRISAIKSLLHYFPIVLIAENGVLRGIISKADVLGNIK
jgi:predicted transcriptional regulator